MASHNPVRIVNIDSLKNIRAFLADLGVDHEGLERLEPKAIHRLVLVKHVSCEQAYLIKQNMLAVGGDSAMSRDAYVFAAKETDILLMGTLKQLGMLCAKLARQPLGLASISSAVLSSLANQESEHKYLYVGQKRFDLSEKTLIAGILNVTPDSFADGGQFLDPDKALSHAIKLAEDGADIIDVGGESSRPGAQPVSLETELERVIPLIEKITQMLEVPVSIDTYKAKVATEAVKAGAAMINDISGLTADDDMLSAAAKSNVALVLMHMKGTPGTMQDDPRYESVVDEVVGFLHSQADKAVAAGMLRSQVLVDPGIGFGKTVEHNLELINNLWELKSTGCPIYVGPSRKSFIGKITGAPADKRIMGTAAAVSASIINGASVVRVHDVAEMTEVVKVVDSIVREKA